MYIPLLIVGGNELERKHQVETYTAPYMVSSFDFHRITPDETKKSIGISQIKSLIRDLLYTPVQGREKIGIIYELQHATVEAQNALLKLLEEPDETTILIATATRKEEILPTIVSRWRFMTVKTSDKYNSSEEQVQELERVLQASEGERLEYAERLVNENRPIEWVRNALQILRLKLLTSARNNEILNTKYQIPTIRTLDRARITLEKTNTNQRLLLENLLLELSE